MNEKQLKQELQNLKTQKEKFNLFQNDNPTEENVISQTPSTTEEEHSSEVDQSPKSPQKIEVESEIKEELHEDLYTTHDNVHQNENLQVYGS